MEWPRAAGGGRGSPRGSRGAQALIRRSGRPSVIVLLIAAIIGGSTADATAGTTTPLRLFTLRGHVPLDAQFRVVPPRLAHSVAVRSLRDPNGIKRDQTG